MATSQFQNDPLNKVVPKTLISGILLDNLEGKDSIAIEILDPFKPEESRSLIRKLYNNTFTLDLSFVDKLSVFYLSTKGRVISNYIEPFDSINLLISKDTVIFKGKGVEKCQIYYELNKLKETLRNICRKDLVSPKLNIEFVAKEYDFIEREMDSQLLKLKNYESAFQYQFILADVYGGGFKAALCNYLNNVLTRLNTLANERFNSDSLSKIFSSIYLYRISRPIRDLYLTDAAAHSRNYLSFLRSKYSLETKIQNFAQGIFWPDTSGFRRFVESSGFLPEYVYFKNYLNGLLREQAINYSFFVQLSGLNILSDLYKKALFASIEDYLGQEGNHDTIKSITKKRYEVIDKATGSIAFNFSLPDSNGKMINLEQYTGKVVVLDFWFTGCIPCFKMAPSFNKVVEHFKNNPDVIFISISSTTDRRNWLKGIGKGKFNWGDGIQLHSSGKPNEEQVFKEYKVFSFPQLRLINRKGSIYSFSPPSSQLNNGKNLINVIEEALKSSF